MSMMKTYGSEPATEVEAAALSFTMTVVKKTMEANWVWVMVYAVMTATGWVVAYGLSGWSGAMTAFLVSLVTLYVGYRLAQTLVATARR
jgi:hypothetical protein